MTKWAAAAGSLFGPRASRPAPKLRRELRPAPGSSGTLFLSAFRVLVLSFVSASFGRCDRCNIVLFLPPGRRGPIDDGFLQRRSGISTADLRQLNPCHTRVLAHAGWGRPPKDKEVWETGKLNRPSLGQVLLSGVQNFTHRNWPAGELFSPKILLFNVEDRLIAGGFHEPGEPGEPGETRSDEIVD